MKSHLPRTSLALVATAAAVIVGAPASHAQEELPVLASANAASDDLGDSTVDVNRVERGAGGYTNISWTVNVRSGSFNLIGMRNDLYLYGDHDMSGVTVLDEEGQTRYHPLVDTEDVCVCAGTFHPGDFVDMVEAEQSSTYWGSYLLPEDVATVTLEVPGFDPVTDIPVE
jgi:hypothetical protein